MYKKFIKRLFDIFLSFIALPFLLPVIAIISLVILFFDKGPIFFNAKRLGKDGKPFRMYKFRTMIVNAPDIRLEDGSTYNAADDLRITPLGRFLRKTSIDELPQILNVLKGDMSLIGPRPDPLDWLERYTKYEKVSLTVKPGISGYNQAFFRNSADSATKLKHDIYYAKNISFLLDLRIAIKTIKTVLLRENIHISKSRKKIINEGIWK